MTRGFIEPNLDRVLGFGVGKSCCNKSEAFNVVGEDGWTLEVGVADHIKSVCAGDSCMSILSSTSLLDGFEANEGTVSIGTVVSEVELIEQSSIQSEKVESSLHTTREYIRSGNQKNCLIKNHMPGYMNSISAMM